jgi:folylpolyglutamate synthase
LKFPSTNQSLDQQPKNLWIPSQDHVYAEIWKRAQPDANIYFESTIQGALNVARKCGRDHNSMQTLITGSQYLVGGALSLLQPTNAL